MSGRQFLAALLALLAVACGLVGGVARYLDTKVIAPAAFEQRALDALDRDAVREALTDVIAARAAQQVPAALLGPEQVRRLADRTIATRPFRRVVRDRAGDARELLFGEDRTRTVALTLADFAPAFGALDPRLGTVIGAAGGIELVTLRADTFGEETRRIADGASTLGVVGPLLAVLALAAALLLSPRRLAVVRIAALASVAAGALLLLALSAGRGFARDRAEPAAGISAEQARDAVGALWDVYLDGLRTWALGAIAVGLLLTAATLLPAAFGRRAKG